ncbi:hemicentin-1 [Periophthalmus magnuspinnatus]|uniref:hemicentin-1 n=1 Tax=Periophthalmus magnuspinnatus TaxID=409849 RepID=UPI002436D2F8|nr:hemicentin-1 [Periophthalmus magnuspinnatus]
MWVSKVIFFIYLSTSCTAQEEALPVPNMHLQSSWFEVFPDELVKLRCNINSKDWTITWYKDEQEVQPSDSSVILSEDSQSLTLNAVAQSQSGKYSCKGNSKTNASVSTARSNALQITVHDTPTLTLSKNPTPNSMYVGETVIFTCDVPRLVGWTYKWYKDDADIGRTGPTLTIVLELSNGGNYSCKALREDRVVPLSSKKITQAVNDIPVPEVKLRSSWTDVFKNEKVILGCETGSTDWRFLWFRNGQPLTGDDSLKITGEEGSTLQIVSASLSHMGPYTCKAQHKSRTVNSTLSQPLVILVYETTPKPKLTKEQQYNPMYVGETVQFICSVDVASGWRFKFFKDEREITVSDSSISIQLSLSDDGKYSCKGMRGEHTNTDSSDEITVTVLEVPLPKVTPLTSWRDVFPTETVELGCEASSAPQDWTYQWQKDDKMDHQISSVSFDSDGAKLSISSASASHQGNYRCKATLKSRSIITSFSARHTLSVYDQKPQPTLVQDPDYSILFPREPMRFHCHINVSSGWSFVWYQNNKELQPRQGTYEVTSPDTTHSGSYTCKGKRGKTHSFSTPISQVKQVEIRKDIPAPVLSQQPDVDKVYLGELVMFKCNLNISSDWEYHWLKNGQPLSVFSNAYTIGSATHQQSGDYKCKAKRRKTLFETESLPKVINISDIPIPSVNNLTSWLDVFPTETVKLHCGMQNGASDWIYTWSKDGQPIKHEDNMKIDKNGSLLTILSSVSHTGEYSCMAKHRKRPVSSTYSSGIRLEVYVAKPSVELVQDPDFTIFYTEDPVTFSCGVNVSSGWEYLWFKDNHIISQSAPSHTIAHAYTSHTGGYSCMAKRGKGGTVFQTDNSRSVKIEVKERPSASIELLTGWSEVFSTDSLVLKCETEDSHDWNFEWFKGGKKIEQLLSEMHTITPQNDPDQSEYMCQGNRTGRPSYTKRSEPLKTNNLLLKRRVLLSISGCLVFGLCAVFLGCIVLKVCHKPAVDQEKPEEVDLFLTRAELSKHAPNPLIEYVTDEDLKEIAKDADEKGTISCESTLLPITSKEDEATPSESNITTGNGEMVSFKQ